MHRTKSLLKGVMALITALSLTVFSNPAAAIACYVTFQRECPGIGPQSTGIYCDGVEKKAACEPLTTSMFVQGGWSTGKSDSSQWEGQCIYTCTYYDCEGGFFEQPEERGETMSAAIGAECSRPGGTGPPPS